MGLGRIAEKLHEFRVDGLLIIGGFEVRQEGQAGLLGCGPEFLGVMSAG